MVNLNIKTLLTQVKKLREQYESKKSYIKLEQQNLELIRKQISSVQEKIDNFGKDKETIISEHAILRYLERVKGLDIEEIKKEILTEEVKEIIKVLKLSLNVKIWAGK